MGNMHYAQLLGQTKMLQHASKVHETIIGYGTFGSEVGINNRLGVPTGIKAGGIGLDIPVSKTIVADNNNQQHFKNYRLQAGMIASSLEHQTPEQMYNTDPQHPVQGISTMKAFALANAQGQKIYTITQQNIDTILPMIQASTLTKNDIQNAVYAGNTVTVHEREVSVPGWRGTGYMVIDPNNADGAYLISGGGNGGWIEALGSLIDNILDNLDEIGAIFHNLPIIKLIAEQLDNFMDLLNVYKKRGAAGFVAGAAILVMIVGITSLMSYALAEAIVLAGVSKVIGWAAMATLYYAMANIFNIIVP